MGEKKHTHLWCPKIKSTQVVKNYILEAQRIIVHLCVCIYTANVLLLYYYDVPGFYCLALDIVYTMNVLQHRNMIMAGKWYIIVYVIECSLCVWVVYIQHSLLWKMLRLTHFVVQVNWTNEKVWIRAYWRYVKRGQKSNFWHNEKTHLRNAKCFWLFDIFLNQ